MGLNEVETRDNHVSQHYLLNLSSSLLTGAFSLNNDLGVTLPQMFILLVLHNNWVLYGHGMNACDVCKDLRYKSSMHPHTMRRLTYLHSIGFVEIIGTGNHSSRIFAPSKYITDYLNAYYLSKAV